MTSLRPAIRCNHVVLLAVCILSACQTPIAAPQHEAAIAQPNAHSIESQNMTRTSQSDFTTTNASLKSAIESRGLTLFNVIDHAAGAAKVDQTLAPNTLYIFGNPKAGTPLMLANPALGLDLPLKANVREDNGQVTITMTDIRAITAAAGVTEPAPVIDNIADALNAIMTEAAGG